LANNCLGYSTVPEKGTDQLAPTGFFQRSWEKELGAKAANDFHHLETRAARKAVSGFLVYGPQKN
jgi:hypothetical protein